jgi:hypothetical protein
LSQSGLTVPAYAGSLARTLGVTEKASMRKLPQGEALISRAKALGVTLSSDAVPTATGPNAIFRALSSEADLQRRVIDAELRLLATRGWIAAVLSSIASIVSALAAWAAIWFSKGT